MSVAADARATILGRVKAATQKSAMSDAALQEAYAAVQRTYVRIGQLSADECIKRMIERLREYDADVVESTPAGLTSAVAAQLKASGRRVFVAPDGLPASWMASGFEWKIDHGLNAAEIEQCEGVVTGAFCGIADSGTIVLHHSGQEGRRVISLLPDWHLCILYATQIVETLPEYFARCPQPPRLATYVSGPSATADIEMTRIKGVHGPRYLNVIVVHDIGAGSGKDRPVAGI